MHMDFSFFVERSLLKISLDVIRYAVGVVSSPGELTRFTPKLSRVQCVSDFCGHIYSTNIP